MPLPLSSSRFIKILIDLTFLVPAYPGCPGKEAVKWAVYLLINCYIVLIVCFMTNFLLSNMSIVIFQYMPCDYFVTSWYFFA